MTQKKQQQQQMKKKKKNLEPDLEQIGCISVICNRYLRSPWPDVSYDEQHGPQNISYYADQRVLPRPSRTNIFIWCIALLCSLAIIALILAGLTVLIAYLLFHPKLPTLDITEATLSRIMLDPSTRLINAEMVALLKFTNPNDRIDVRYEYINFKLFFREDMIATQVLEPFAQRRGLWSLRSIDMVSLPIEPIDGISNSVNQAAVEHYRWIIERVHAYGMRVMLTLFHHSLPPWAAAYGGWKLEKTVNYFLEFTKIAVENFAHLVDYWVTFNEPHVFAMLTYCAGAWPGGHPGLLEVATAAMPQGVFNHVMHWMAVAHSKAFDLIHESSTKSSPRARVGLSHHVSFMRPYGLFDVPAVVLSNTMTMFPYVDSVSDKLDFLGINYYGQEVLSAPGLKLVDNDEYSESGRGVYPDGMYRVLLKFHERYKHLNLPFIITENGVSDTTDLIRRPYILEHLLAVRAAMDKGVRILGYLFWTTSDNWEWADGYGPKFGLVAVDRANNLARIPRPSYFLFSEVVKTGRVTQQQREIAWNELQIAAAEGKTRPFYRADKNGLMYSGGLDIPIQRHLVQRDWRFNHYQFDGLKDPLSCISRFVFAIFFWKRGGKRKLKKNSTEGHLDLNYSSTKDKFLPSIDAELSEEKLQPAAV